MPHVFADNLCKTFKVAEREGGLTAAMKALFHRKYKEVKAVDAINVGIEQGEIVGFLGPNGAGKTTALKMLTGLLHPTAGTASVLGHTPWKREPAFLRRISLVMGQRSQLNWDLPAIDSFLVHLAIYGVEKVEGRRRIDELVTLLELGNVLKKQVRTLSLGERMKCELCCSLLHQPDVLFLDEPTIGVDITMQARIRQFIGEYNRKFGATIILTSHYMADVTALCKRIIVINQGRLLFDGPLAELADRLAPFKVIVIDLERDLDPGVPGLGRFGEVVASEPRKITLKVAKDEAATTTTRLLAELPVLDLTISDPPIEDVITQVFRVTPAA